MEKFLLQAFEQFAEILLRFVRNEDGRLRESRPVPQDSRCLNSVYKSWNRSSFAGGCFNLSYKERDSDDPRLTQIHGYILSPLYKPGHATGKGFFRFTAKSSIGISKDRFSNTFIFPDPFDFETHPSAIRKTTFFI